MTPKAAEVHEVLQEEFYNAEPLCEEAGNSFVQYSSRLPK
jgi:hypothetical protein